MAQYMRITAANDSLAMACSAWLSALVIVWEKVTPGRSLLLGLLLAAGCLSKACAFPFVAVAGLWVFARCQGWRILAVSCLLVFVPPVAGLTAHYVYSSMHGGWHYFSMNPVFFRMVRHLEGDCLHPVLEKLGTWRLFFHGYGNMSEVRSPGDIWWILLALPPFVSLWTRPLSSRYLQRAVVVLCGVLFVYAAGIVREILSVQRTGFTGRHFLVLQLPIGLLLMRGWSCLFTGLLGHAKVHPKAELSAACLLAGAVLLINRHDLLQVVQRTYYGSSMKVWLPQDLIFDWVCGNLPEPLKIPLFWYAVFVAATALTYGLVVFFAMTVCRALAPGVWRRIIR
jgi:hypothetical protein